MSHSASSGQACPKCGGKLAPYNNYPGSDIHCLICGWYQMPWIKVVMPEVPPLGKQPSQEPAAIRHRQYMQERRTHAPHRKRTAAINKEVNQ